jgi:hypothetical protein
MKIVEKNILLNIAYLLHTHTQPHEQNNEGIKKKNARS